MKGAVVRVSLQLGVVVLGWLLPWAFCIAEPQPAVPLTWLERMGQVGQGYTYDGVLIYRRADKMHTLRLFQETLDGEPVEHLQSLDGVPQEITLTNQHLSCQLANYQVVLNRSGQRSVLWPIATRDWTRVQQHYQIELGEQMRIAGRESQVLRITPKDQARYGQTLWLDAQTAFPLRADLFDAVGNNLSQWSFTTLSLTALPAKAPRELPLVPKSIAGAYRLHLREPEPLGFRVVMRSAGVEDTINWAEHWMLSDGLATVSVYLEPHTEASTGYLKGLSEHVPIHAYGRSLGAYHLTVVGEVPAATVQTLATQFELTLP